MIRRTTRLLAAGLAFGLAAALTASAQPAATAGTTPASPQPVAPLGHSGRWLTDATGRVVMLHGVNEVEKSAPFFPAATGFGDDDAKLLARQGLRIVRLGIVWEALEPQPGVIDHAYIDHLAATVETLSRHKIFVLLDFHQDGWGPATHGNGAPAWATITDGYPNTDVGFPLYYIGNPALQRAFDNFWMDTPASDGVGIQTHYIRAASAVASRFARSRYVVGYDPMNEPWPGTVWDTCVTGCPDIESSTLVPFSQRFAAAVTAVDPNHIVFPEPFVLFNFGQTDTALPAVSAPRNGLSTHIYATSTADNLAAIDNSVTAATRTQSALLATEWGAFADRGRIRLGADQFDSRLVSWIFWAYNEQFLHDFRAPASGSNVRWPAVDALTRPYPIATNGTPGSFSYEPLRPRLRYTYSTTLPNGRAASSEQVTTILLPSNAFPKGRHVVATGATVVNQPDAGLLVLRNSPGVTTVSVTIT